MISDDQHHQHRIDVTIGRSSSSSTTSYSRGDGNHRRMMIRQWLIASIVAVTIAIVSVKSGSVVVVDRTKTNQGWMTRYNNDPQLNHKSSKASNSKGNLSIVQQQEESNHELSSDKKNHLDHCSDSNGASSKVASVCTVYWGGEHPTHQREELEKYNQEVTSSSSYTWMSDQWYPPAGVPRYTPQNMRDLWRDHNVLFLGDSTGRQDFFTLYNLMNATDPNDITMEELNQGINTNRHKFTETCTLRADDVLEFLSVCRQVPHLVDPEGSLASISSNDHNNGTTRMRGAMDLVLNPEPCNCFGNVPSFIDDNYSVLLRDYTVLVFSLGIWEVVKSEDCPDSGMAALMETLDYLKEFSETTHIQVVWKTHGGGSYESKSERRFTKHIQLSTRHWFARNQPLHYMTLSDFGTQVLPRTYGDRRIEGDSSNHFGPHARTLSLQMITDALYGQVCHLAEDDHNEGNYGQ